MQSSSLSLASIANQTEGICVPPPPWRLCAFSLSYNTANIILHLLGRNSGGVPFGHSQWPSQMIWKGSCKKTVSSVCNVGILFVFSADVCKYLSRKQRQKVSGTKVDWSTVQICLFVRKFFWRWLILIKENNSTCMGTLDVVLRLSYFLMSRIYVKRRTYNLRAYDDNYLYWCL